MPLSPEQKAREAIDADLESAGWLVQDAKDIDLTAGRGYEEPQKRDKLSLDLFWIRDRALTDTDSLPAPDVLAAEIADDLEAALAQFTRIAARLPSSAEQG